jgi:toxin ParE1/3/4
MSLLIVWTQPARAQLAELHEYISQTNISAADRHVAILLHAVSGLTAFPEMGRPGRRRRTRELVVSGTPYIVAYRFARAEIEILAVMHAARQWPRSFDIKQ